MFSLFLSYLIIVSVVEIDLDLEGGKKKQIKINLFFQKVSHRYKKKESISCIYLTI